MLISHIGFSNVGNQIQLNTKKENTKKKKDKRKKILDYENSSENNFEDVYDN